MNRKRRNPGAARRPKGAAPKQSGKRPIPVVGLGASAGGLEAFEQFFSRMPAGSGMAFVLVAHLDPTHVSTLPELLSRSTKMKVLQAENGMKVRPDTIYVIPPNREIVLSGDSLRLREPKDPRGARLPID